MAAELCHFIVWDHAMEVIFLVYCYASVVLYLHCFEELETVSHSFCDEPEAHSAKLGSLPAGLRSCHTRGALVELGLACDAGLW